MISTNVRWRIFDPKLIPFETYYVPDDIVSIYASNIPLVAAEDPKKTPPKQGRLLCRVLCPRKEDDKRSSISETEEVRSVIGYKRKRQEEEEEDDESFDRLVWSVTLISDDDNNTSKLPVNGQASKNTNDSNPIVNNPSIIHLTTDQFQIVFGSTATITSKNRTEIIITPTTDNFRQIASKYCDITNHDERIIEIGCSTGETSRLLWNRMEKVQASSSSSSLPSSSKWIGFDTSKQMIDSMQQKLVLLEEEQQQKRYGTSGPQIHRACACLNILANPGAALDIINKEFGSMVSPTILFLDIGGNRDEYTVLRMLSWILNIKEWDNHLRLIVIKSEQLVESLLKQNDYCDLKSGIVHDGIGFLQQRLLVLEQTQCTNESTNDATINDYDIEATSKQTESTILMRKQYFPKHPLQAPKRYYSERNPFDGDHENNNMNDRTVLICRYHNYHKDGCKKYLDPMSHCPFDHDHCHLCLQEGHVARICPSRFIR